MSHPSTVAPPYSSPSLNPTFSWLMERAAKAGPPESVPPSVSDPGGYAESLVAAGRHADAFRLIACALPPREGIWWAWVSARHAVQSTAAAGTPAPPVVLDALTAVERWIAQPNDEMRRAAWTAGQAAGLDGPAGCAAAAVYFSGGSIAPHDAPMIPPPPGLHSFMIAAAVTLAAVADPQHLDAVASAYVAQAAEIVKQLGGWERATSVAREYHEAQRAQHQQAAAPPPSRG